MRNSTSARVPKPWLNGTTSNAWTQIARRKLLGMLDNYYGRQLETPSV
jgi:hypothetical protein